MLGKNQPKWKSYVGTLQATNLDLSLNYYDASPYELVKVSTSIIIRMRLQTGKLTQYRILLAVLLSPTLAGLGKCWLGDKSNLGYGSHYSATVQARFSRSCHDLLI